MKRWFEPSVARYMCALFLVLSAWQGITAEQRTASAEEASVLKGRVSDADGRAVEGAKIFVYDSPDVRRPANFISAGTDKGGMFRMTVSPGRYWVVARLKKTEDYGPLLPGDKHSGEPVEGEIASRSEITMDFIVADLKEAIKIKTKSRERHVKISGRIIDEKGFPVVNFYALASRNEKVE
jgi:protocatechuate 3,4-dioxygenase beta subunit